MFGIRHEGAFAGGGTFRLAPADGGAATVVDWDESGSRRLSSRMPRRSSRRRSSGMSSQADLRRLRDLVESGAA